MVPMFRVVSKYRVTRTVEITTLYKVSLSPESTTFPRNVVDSGHGKLASVPFCLQPSFGVTPHHITVIEGDRSDRRQYNHWNKQCGFLCHYLLKVRDIHPNFWHFV